MLERIENALRLYDSGTIGRRELLAFLGTTLMMAANTNEASPRGSESTFRATGVNHVALRVTDVEKSRDFYIQHLGMKVAREQKGSSCFLTCGDNFVALFRGSQPGMDHYCYSVSDYDVSTAETKLKREGFNPRVAGGDGRIYFKDPDGLTVQLASETHRP